MADARTATALAQATDSRVEILAERTEYRQVFAEPSGHLTYETGVLPQRVHRADGSWADLDLSLAKAADGTIRPKASVADVRFSPGGSGPLVTLVNAGKTLSLRWPGAGLFAPAVADDTATYPEVLPGVDLAVRATPVGFSHVLVVKTAAAAANPALREIHFDMGGDARVLRLPDDSLKAVAGPATIASAAAPTMWDSRTATASAKAGGAAVAAAGGEPSTHEGPGDSAQVAAVQTEVTSTGDLVLRPDTALLGGQATFPVFIDPAWSKTQGRWAYATNNNSTNEDVTRARVGRDPNSSKIYRSFFQFSTSALKDKHVESAYVQMRVDQAYSCTDTWTYMYQSAAMSGSPRTSWSTKLGGRLSAAASHGDEADGCGAPQPDEWVNFTGAAVTSFLQSVATKGSPTATIGFSASPDPPAGTSESDKTRWKKFYLSNAVLIADVDAIPGKPTSLQVNGVACGNGSTVKIGTTTPYFSAVMPDGDASQSIAATWQWQHRLANGDWIVKGSPPRSSTSANKRATSAPVPQVATDGETYSFQVKGTDPSPYSQTGAWSSPLCYFFVDTQAPKVEAAVESLPAGPGKVGSFVIHSPALDVTTFRYGWNEAVTSQAVPGTVDGYPGEKAAKVSVTAPKYGENVLYVQAIDGTLNKGTNALAFSVDRPSPAVAYWGLQSYPGIDTTAALADSQPALAGDTPLAPSGITWTDKGRIVGGTNATFNGTQSAATAAGVVDTTKGYSVAAWVKLDQVTSSQTIVSQDGEHTANFALQYRSDDRNGDGVADKSWCMLVRDTDADASTAVVAACAVNAAATGRWTHVAGGYDAAENKVRLWVDGVLKAEVAAHPAWGATGPTRVGNRRNTSTQWVEGLVGSVADVQVFDRVIVANDFTGMRGDDDTAGADLSDEPGILQPITVGKWNFDGVIPCYDPAIPDTCEALDQESKFGRRLALTQGSDKVVGDDGDGEASDGVELDNQYFTDDPTDPLYGSTTREYATSQANNGSGAAPQWQDAAVLRSDQSFTVSATLQPGRLDVPMTALAVKGVKQSPLSVGVRTSTVDGVTGPRFEVMVTSADQNTGQTVAHVIAPTVLDDTDTELWAHLTVAYDAASKQLCLYINGDLAAHAVVTSVWNATGPLIVGNGWASPSNAAAALTDQWFGGVDDVIVQQGAMTAAAAHAFFQDQTDPST